MIFHVKFLGFALSWATVTSAQTSQPQLVLPEGFEVNVFADDHLAHDIFCLAIDARGRVFVSGPGYIRLLDDANQDGRAERAIDFARDEPRTLQGMMFDGPILYGMSSQGIMRYIDDDGDDRADRTLGFGPILNVGGEHGGHAILPGPDGDLYFILGNSGKFPVEALAPKTSPVVRPVQGNIFRIRRDGSWFESVFTGLRNSCDFIFLPNGDILGVDSDNEREPGLPWYLPCRLYHAIPGLDFGWRDSPRMRPEHYFDKSPAAGDIGRGSPTGMVIYQHHAFPETYRDAVLLADWSWSRIVHFKMQRAGATYTADTETFIHTGQTFTETIDPFEQETFANYADAFYPSDMDVAPDGSLYICMGGRDTKGVVYRVRYTGDRPGQPWDPKALPDHIDLNIRKAVCLPQPSSAWARAETVKLRKAASEKAWNKDLSSMALLGDSVPLTLRLRALQLLLASNRSDAMAGSFIQELSRQADPQVRSMAGEAIRVCTTPLDNGLYRMLLTLLKDGDPLVRRRAVEAWPAVLGGRQAPTFASALANRLDDADRVVRLSAAAALERFPSQLWRSQADSAKSLRVRRYAAFIDVRHLHRSLKDAEYVQLLVDSLSNDTHVDALSETLRLTALLAKAGFVTKESKGYMDLSQLLLRTFSHVDPRINRLFADVAGLMKLEAAIDPLLARLATKDPDLEKFHFLRRLGEIPTHWSGDRLSQLIEWWVGQPEDHRVIAEIWKPVSIDAPAEVVSQLLEIGHSGLLLDAPLTAMNHQEFARVADAFLANYIHFHPRTRMTVLRRIGQLARPADAGFVRAQVNDPAVRSVAVTALTSYRDADDEAIYQDGLSDDDWQYADRCLMAVIETEAEPDDRMVFDLIVQYGRAIDRPERSAMRKRISQTLLQWTEFDPSVPGDAEDASTQLRFVKAWQGWFDETYPLFDDDFPSIVDPQRLDYDRRNAVGELLRRVRWERGNPDRGKGHFDALGCIKCHTFESSGIAVGPDLTGAGQRLNRRDLLEAIVRPSAVVPDRYRYVLFQMKDGLAVAGIVERDDDNEVMIRTAGAGLMTLSKSDILAQAPQRLSLMPTGVLETASERDIADLFAFLATGQPHVDGVESK